MVYKTEQNERVPRFVEPRVNHLSVSFVPKSSTLFQDELDNFEPLSNAELLAGNQELIESGAIEIIQVSAEEFAEKVREEGTALINYTGDTKSKRDTESMLAHSTFLEAGGKVFPSDAKTCSILIVWGKDEAGETHVAVGHVVATDGLKEPLTASHYKLLRKELILQKGVLRDSIDYRVIAGQSAFIERGDVEGDAELMGSLTNEARMELSGMPGVESSDFSLGFSGAEARALGNSTQARGKVILPSWNKKNEPSKASLTLVQMGEDGRITVFVSTDSMNPKTNYARTVTRPKKNCYEYSQNKDFQSREC